MRIRKGDSVVVLSGDDAGTTPHKVIQILDGGRRLVVEGVNSVFKHVRRGHPKSPSGGRLSLDLPIDSSNVALYCNSCHKGTRVGYRFTADGTKERFCRKCGAAAGTVGGPRKQRVKV
ncbi:MAG: 50S ribosomal protein L24 [Planctomycetales bacterium]